MVAALSGWLNLAGTIAMIFLALCCVGMTNPNTSALSMAPFSRNAGVASALLGALQLGLGSVSSSAVSIFNAKSVVPLAAIMAVTAFIALAVLLIGRRNIVNTIHADPATAVSAH